jgi:hypothetical protein
MAERPGTRGGLGVALAARLSAVRRSLLGASPPSGGDLLVASCLQCGRDRTDVVHRAHGRVRVSCRACGAITLQDTSRLRSAANERAAGAATVADGPPPPHPLAPYVSAELLDWARETGRDRRGAKLDKPTIYRLWKEFDRRDTGPSGDGGTGGSRSGGAPPPFGEVAGMLHARCYDEDAVLQDLLGADPDAARTTAIAERTACARRWLAGPGREHCWIDRRTGDEPVDIEVVRSLLDDGALGGTLDGTQREALYGAAFGTPGGPPTREIMRRFDAATIAAALRTHLDDGSHPLRETVLAALGGRAAPDPLTTGETLELRVPC